MTSQEVDSVFKVRKPESNMYEQTIKKIDLKQTYFRNLETCNDQFLAFIEKVRVLSEATDIRLSLPRSL